MAYESIMDAAVRRAFDYLEQLTRRFALASQSQLVSVTFPSTANQDQIVSHKLTPSAVESVYYEVVKADRACHVYHDASSTRRAWTSSYIILRCDTASAAVTLRLFLAPS